MQDNVAIVAVLIPIVAIIAGVGLIALLRKFINDERMAMIEKGLTFPEKKPQKIDPSGILTAGFLFFGAGIGLVIAKFVSSNFPDEAASLYFGMILIFGGLGLLTSYLIQYRLAERAKKGE